MFRFCVVLYCAFTLCSGQQQLAPTPPNSGNLHNAFSERIGNFSIELLHHTAQALGNNQNLILAPLTVWTVLALTAEGAAGATLREIRIALRLSNDSAQTREHFKNAAKWLTVNTTTIELAKLGVLFADATKLPLRDFVDKAKSYDTTISILNFTDAVNTAAKINQAVAGATHGRITKLVEPDDFTDTHMILTSAVYFRGQWTLPFNRSKTERKPFYDSDGKQIGEVNMMYSRYNYPFANIKELQARVIELPYGVENRLSMLIMLPYQNVTVEDMFLNFNNVHLDKLFTELRVSKEEYGDDEVDCFLPRFKIESSIEMTDIFKNMFFVRDLFDPRRADLPYLSRLPMYVSRIIHKAEIEVNEEGTTASGVTAAEFSNRISSVRFEVNKPFTYIIIEKVTNTIVFGGFYKIPSLY